MSKTTLSDCIDISATARLARRFVQGFSFVAVFFIFSCSALAQWAGREAELEAVKTTFGEPPNMVRLDPESRVWADKKSKRVVVDGFIALTQGQLEMLACIAGTKEHESVVGVFSKAQFVHAGLLAIGAEQGKPVTWEPKYIPPSGSEIQVFALWKDKDGNKKTIDTRNWIRKIGTESETLDTNFVFTGSTMWTDPDTGNELYGADIAGELICVSNFQTSTLDVPVKSLQANNSLLFAAFTKRIPERFTPVRLVLQLVEPARSADARAAAIPTADAGSEKIPSELESLANPPK